MASGSELVPLEKRISPALAQKISAGAEASVIPVIVQFRHQEGADIRAKQESAIARGKTILAELGIEEQRIGIAIRISSAIRADLKGEEVTLLASYDDVRNISEDRRMPAGGKQ